MYQKSTYVESSPVFDIGVVECGTVARDIYRLGLFRLPYIIIIQTIPRYKGRVGLRVLPPLIRIYNEMTVKLTVNDRVILVYVWLMLWFLWCRPKEGLHRRLLSFLFFAIFHFIFKFVNVLGQS